jgi:hypothetical protein
VTRARKCTWWRGALKPSKKSQVNRGPEQSLLTNLLRQRRQLRRFCFSLNLHTGARRFSAPPVFVKSTEFETGHFLDGVPVINRGISWITE